MNRASSYLLLSAALWSASLACTMPTAAPNRTVGGDMNAVTETAAPTTLAPSTPTPEPTAPPIDSVVPRNFDLWVLYPDGTLRFATLFYMDEDSDQAGQEVVTVAGPLVFNDEDLVSISAIGGRRTGMEMLPGPSQDRDLLYPLLTLRRDKDGAPYGIDVTTVNSPHLVAATDFGIDDAPEGTQILSLGLANIDGMKEVMIAVALPTSADVQIQSGAGNIPFLHSVEIGGWVVYYFDSLAASDDEAIRIHFLMQGDDAPDDLDLMEADQHRTD